MPQLSQARMAEGLDSAGGSSAEQIVGRLKTLVATAIAEEGFASEPTPAQIRAYLRSRGEQCTPLQARAVHAALTEPEADRGGGDSPTGTFGARLAAAREAKFLSRRAVADEVGCSESYLSLLETGRRSPSEEMLTALARAVGKEAQWLRSGSASQTTKRIADLLQFTGYAIERGDDGMAERCLDELEAGDLGRPLNPDEQDMACWYRGRVRNIQNRHLDVVHVLEPLIGRLLSRDSRLEVVGPCQDYLSAANLATDAGLAPPEVLTEVVGKAQQLLDGIPRTKRDEHWWRAAATAMASQWSLGNNRAAIAMALGWMAELAGNGASVPSGVAALRWNLALVLKDLGRLDEALTHIAAADQLHDHVQYAVDGPRLKLAHADILMRARPDRVDEAIRVMEEIRPAVEALTYERDRYEWHVWRAEAELIARRPAAALRFLEPVLGELSNGEITLRAAAWMVLGDAHLQQADTLQATAAYRRALTILQDAPAHRGNARQWRDLGDRLARIGAVDEALTAMRQALSTLDVPELPGPPLP